MSDMTEKHKPLPINGQPSGLVHHKKRKSSRILVFAIAIIISVIIGASVAAVMWVDCQLAPLDASSVMLKKITVSPGSSSSQIGQELEKQSIIKSATAFNIYIKLMHGKEVLQAGTYRLSPAETTPQIIEHFINGTVDQFSITFYPGATLVDNSDKPKPKKYDVTTVLQNAGFSDQEIASALSKTYDSPLFLGKPTGTDLEGYVFGETYKFNIGATVENILEGVFAEFYSVIQENNLVKAFAEHNLSLYEGITLASIVQREANTPADQKQVAQVFYSRLAMGMQLGSDVTYQYIADRDGLVRDPNLDSPYNTRIKAGLPPGPIAAPGLSALLAVAQPATGNYVYFLSDIDGKLYFANTLAEHESNIVNYCKEACATP